MHAYPCDTNEGRVCTCEALPWSASCWRVMAMELGAPGEHGSYIGCPLAGLMSLQWHRVRH